MACNFLPAAQQKPIHSDTMSEVSESTTTSGWASRWDSREDLRDLIAKLGLNDVSELFQERFRVDRTKLEQMLTGDHDALFPADVFFAQVMEDTDTIITWPNKLKIGAKSKKDPHVRVAGRPEDVQTAKDRILTLLNTRCNRVTMKMDVSYTDHSHIIGKGGLSIKRVMEETRCHVHFPDSNRSNSNEKSNQVSISGDITGVELARSRVRELIPLIFGFELPIMSQDVDVNSPHIVKIQEQYRVQVMFKTRPKLHATLVLVKGLEWEVNQVKHATLLLKEHLCKHLANQIPVQMSMEISHHHHSVVLGKSHANLKAITKHTNCQIMFPDAQDPNIPSLKKSNVTITGNIHNIYEARQLLMGSLPLILIFDLPEDSQDIRVKQEQILEIQSSCDVTISIRQKANKTIKACIIKGIERHASEIYRARNLILGIDEPPIHADIPPSYALPEAATETSASGSGGATAPVASAPVSAPPEGASSVENLMSPLITTTCYVSSPTMSQQSGPPFAGGAPRHFFPSNNLNLSPVHHQGNFATNGGFSQAVSSGQASQASQLLDKSNYSTAPTSPFSVFSAGSGTASAYQSVYESNRTVGLSELNIPGQYHRAGAAAASSDGGGGEDSLRKLAAVKGMRAGSVSGALRLPNIWNDYAMSHTSPEGFLVDRFRREAEIWQPVTPRQRSGSEWSPPNGGGAANGGTGGGTTGLNTSNLLEHTPTHVWNRVNNFSNWHDLPSLLSAMNLDHYVPLFKQNEIDLTVFATLTDHDLASIGVTTFGARRRILLAISELNKRNTPFAAAPGAERRNLNANGSSSSGGDNGSTEARW